MPRIARAAPGGQVYHVLNRGNGRCRLFHKEADYAAFERLLFEVREAVPVRVPEPWPVARPGDWPAVVNAAMPKDQLERVQTSVRRGRPFGSDPWVTRTAERLGLQFTLRDRGRPPKPKAEGQ